MVWVLTQLCRFDHFLKYGCIDVYQQNQKAFAVDADMKLVIDGGGLASPEAFDQPGDPMAGAATLDIRVARAFSTYLCPFFGLFLRNKQAVTTTGHSEQGLRAVDQLGRTHDEVVYKAFA